MGISKNHLYVLLLLFCVAGNSWLFMHVHSSWANVVGPVCLLKKTTGIPCPSCGSTRSMIALVHGELIEGILWNPIGLILFCGLIIFPIWLVYDFCFRKHSLYLFCKHVEKKIVQKHVAWPLIVLLLLNWCWNIYKGV